MALDSTGSTWTSLTNRLPLHPPSVAVNHNNTWDSLSTCHFNLDWVAISTDRGNTINYNHPEEYMPIAIPAISFSTRVDFVQQRRKHQHFNFLASIRPSYTMQPNSNYTLATGNFMGTCFVDRPQKLR